MTPPHAWQPSKCAYCNTSDQKWHLDIRPRGLKKQAAAYGFFFLWELEGVRVVQADSPGAGMGDNSIYTLHPGGLFLCSFSTPHRGLVTSAINMGAMAIHGYILLEALPES